MLTQTLGFIGAGNMATAIIHGLITKGLVKADQVFISDADPEQVARLSSATGVNAAETNAALATRADVIIIATKPHHVAPVLEEIRGELDPARHLVISICAGVTTARMEAAAAVEGLAVVRVMPNTPALVGFGSAAIAAGSHVTDAQLDLAAEIFAAVGISVIMSEDKLDAVTGVSGSGPAYVFFFIESLIAAAVAQGLSEDEAEALVPQMVYGAAKMAVEDSRSLAALRQAVTTPGGTTAAGVAALEQGGFSLLLGNCVAAATRRSRELA